jgi:histidinol-phosphate aminotransferase
MSKITDEMLRSCAEYPLAREYDVRVPAALNLASNESPYGPSPAVLRAVRRELRFSGMYPDPRATRLKEAIGKYLGVNADCVSIGNGSDELMDLVCKALLDPGDRVLIPIPTFAMYELSCRAYGGEPVFHELPNFEWLADDITRAARGTNMAFIGRPNNPTGNGLSMSGLRGLLKVGRPVVVDEAYADFAGYSIAKLAAASENLIVLRTLSKAFGLAGLRVGYAVSSPDLTRILERIRAPFNVNRLAQVAGIAALRNRRYVDRVVGLVRRGRLYLSDELRSLGLRVLPSEANFIMADATSLGIDGARLCDLLAERKIFLRDLSGFRGAGARYVRITVGTPRQNERLVGALDRIAGGGLVGG